MLTSYKNGFIFVRLPVKGIRRANARMARARLAGPGRGEQGGRARVARGDHLTRRRSVRGDRTVGPLAESDSSANLLFLPEISSNILNLTTHSMTPILPTEILAHTFALANEDLPPVERQLNRQRFALVCRGWFRAVDKWSEIVVDWGLALRDLRDELRADDHFDDLGRVVGPRVKSLHFLLKTASAAWQTTLGEIFEHVPNLTRLVISAEPGTKRTFGATLPGQFNLVPKLHELLVEGVGISGEGLAKYDDPAFVRAICTLTGVAGLWAGACLIFQP